MTTDEFAKLLRRLTDAHQDIGSDSCIAAREHVLAAFAEVVRERDEAQTELAQERPRYLEARANEKIQIREAIALVQECNSLREAPAQARRAALEEAFKICRAEGDSHDGTSHASRFAAECVYSCADNIRALAAAPPPTKEEPHIDNPTWLEHG